MVSVEQHMGENEDRTYSEKPANRKPKYNWLQAFSVLSCMMGQKHLKRIDRVIRPAVDIVSLLQAFQILFGMSGTIQDGFPVSYSLPG